MSISLVTLSAPDAAAADKADKAALASAKKLVAEGQKALSAKDYATALQKFRSAESLNHAASSTLGEARAMVGLGQLAQAQKMYIQLADEAKTLKPAPPAEAAKEAKALAPRVPHVTVAVAGVDAASATITIDSDTVASTALASPIAVDPGAHFAHAEAPGFDAVDEQFDVAEGATQTVTLTFHASAPAAAAPVASDDSSGGHGGHTRRVIGEVMLVGGGIGLAFGAVTGIIASKKHSSLTSSCPDNICTESSRSAIQTYHSDANLSTVGFIAGGALGVVGLILTVLPVHDSPPKDSAPGPAASAASANRGFHFQPTVGLGMVGGQGEF